MNPKNKFGFEGLPPRHESQFRKRAAGPMGTAVRETAESMQESTEAKVEQRRQNATDAKEYRAARDEGRVLVNLALDKILTDDLPRDRLDLAAVAASDAMQELMASIASRGQREPIEVYRDAAGAYQLKKGWRRLTALRQLLTKSGDSRFSTVVARVAVADEDRVALYVDMVEENVVREDLTFAEMAQLAITAAQDKALGFEDADAAITRLYASLHKVKRSYIRAFASLLEELGDALQWPKSVARNVGVEVARKLKAGKEGLPVLKAALETCSDETEQAAVLSGFAADRAADRPTSASKPARQKFEFHVGDVKVTARNGECRIVTHLDYTEVPKEKLERAVRAFQEALK